MVSVFTGLLEKEGRVNISVDTRLQTEYLYIHTNCIESADRKGCFLLGFLINLKKCPNCVTTLTFF